MSNEIVPMSAEDLQASAMGMFKGGAMSARATTAAASVSVAMGVSYHRLSLDRNRLTIISPSGEETTARNGVLYGVFIAAAPNVHRLYWTKSFKSGETGPPSCVSPDGVTPLEESSDKQADTCSVCPNNMKGSGDDGKSKACKYSLPMVFVPLKSQEDGARRSWSVIPTPVLFNVNSTSMFGEGGAVGMSLKGYNALLSQGNAQISEVITRIVVDDDATHSCTAAFMNVDWADDSVQNVIREVLNDHGSAIEDMISIGSNSTGVTVNEPASQSASEAGSEQDGGASAGGTEPQGPAERAAPASKPGGATADAGSDEQAEEEEAEAAAALAIANEKADKAKKARERRAAAKAKAAEEERQVAPAANLTLDLDAPDGPPKTAEDLSTNGASTSFDI